SGLPRSLGLVRSAHLGGRDADYTCHPGSVRRPRGAAGGSRVQGADQARSAADPSPGERAAEPPLSPTASNRVPRVPILVTRRTENVDRDRVLQHFHFVVDAAWHAPAIARPELLPAVAEA